MPEASTVQAEYEPLLSTCEWHDHDDTVNASSKLRHQDRAPDLQNDARPYDRKLQKTPSESSSEATAAEENRNDQWVPSSDSYIHPPQREWTNSELDASKPFWVPYPDEKEKPRTLVLCFDGTGDQFDGENSNVIQFFASLRKDDKTKQVVYYQTGIGTTTTSNFITPVMNQISKTFDSMFAWNLSSHVQDGYHFLVQNYKADDRISIFGFSRGAYTARALAGMIQRVGLLPVDNTQQIPFAWSMYIRDDADAEKDSAEYKKTFSANVDIDFVGVWDTVASVGVSGKELPFVKDNTAIRVFRHALSLDEHRAKFMPNFYHANSPADTSAITGVKSVSPDLINVSTISPAAKDPTKSTMYPKKDRNTPADACEVWFAGCHCDIGGGSVKNNTAHSLARIPLRWMIRECFRMKTGIVFDARILHEEIGLDWTKLYPEVQTRPERIPWSDNMGSIQEAEPQGWGIITFAKFVILLAAIPIRILLETVIWPVRHTWLFLKWTKPVKWALDNPVKQGRENLGIDKAISDFKDIWSWVNVKLFPKANIVPKPCEIGCKTEEDHEYWDALSPIYDQLKSRWLWTVIEYLPLRFVEQTNGRNRYYVAFNRGQGRKIYGDALWPNVAVQNPGASDSDVITYTIGNTNSTPVPVLRHTQGTYRKTGGLKIHRSVLTRLEAATIGQARYKPLAWWDHRYGVDCEGSMCPRDKGPDNWEIPDPDPAKLWEWVE